MRGGCLQEVLNIVIWLGNFWYFENLLLRGGDHFQEVALMSRIECKYCLISTEYLARLFDIFILLHIWQNRPFAPSSHVVWNKLCWDANNVVWLPKQRKVGLDWLEFLCFGSPTAFFASKRNLYGTMWLDPAKGLLRYFGFFWRRTKLTFSRGKPQNWK